jgi:hypothetical protein
LGGGEQPLFPTLVEDLPVAAQNRGDDPAVAGELSDGVGGERGAGGPGTYDPGGADLGG